MILLKSLIVLLLLRLLKNLFSIHFSSSQDNQYPRWVEIKMLAFQKAFLPSFWQNYKIGVTSWNGSLLPFPSQQALSSPQYRLWTRFSQSLQLRDNYILVHVLGETIKSARRYVTMVYEEVVRENLEDSDGQNSELEQVFC